MVGKRDSDTAAFKCLVSYHIMLAGFAVLT